MLNELAETRAGLLCHLFPDVEVSRFDAAQIDDHLDTGLKSSGIGRDGGDWSFDFYMETKNIAFATKPHAIQKLGG